MLDQTISLQRQQLLNRIRPDSTFAEDLRSNVNAAFGVLDRFEAERDRINRDGKLSDQGKRAEISELVKSRFAPALASGPARRARHGSQRNESRRVALGKPIFDQNNLVAALDRQEVRAFVRNQPTDKRMTTALDLVLDKKLGEALLSGNGRALTGLTEQQFAEAHKLFLRHHFGDEIKEIDGHLADIDALASSVQLVWTKLSGASGMTETQFIEFWATLEQAADRS